MALSDELFELENAKTKIQQDVLNLQNFTAGLKQNVADLTKLVEDLQANGVTPEALAKLQAITADINAADAAFDAIAPDPVEPAPAPEG